MQQDLKKPGVLIRIFRVTSTTSHSQQLSPLWIALSSVFNPTISILFHRSGSLLADQVLDYFGQYIRHNGQTQKELEKANRTQKSTDSPFFGLNPRVPNSDRAVFRMSRCLESLRASFATTRRQFRSSLIRNLASGHSTAKFAAKGFNVKSTVRFAFEGTR